MKSDKFVPIQAPKRTPRPAPIPRAAPTEREIRDARAVLQRVLFDMRSPEQGGYLSRTRGKWDFVSSSLGQLTPDELDALFAFAGIEPDEIEVVGSCWNCANSKDGRERGYERPCLTCLRPSHINGFVPKERLEKRK